MKKTLLLFTLIAGFTQSIKGQTTLPTQGFINVPAPSYSFAIFSPIDAATTSMGYGGMALFKDETATFLNPAMLVHSPNRTGLFVGYTPWLRKLVSDMFIWQGGGYYQIDKKSVLSSNITYFRSGTFLPTNAVGQLLEEINANNWAVGLNYSRRFSDKLSMAVGMKYLSEHTTDVGANTNMASSNTNLVLDISMAHVEPDVFKKLTFNYGISITNIGGKVRDVFTSQESFLPTNLKIGIVPTYRLDAKNKMSFTVDAYKLLISTWNSKHYKDSALQGIVASFSDAPGGLSEELREIVWSLGMQYSYNDFLFLRAGRFIEAQDKGNRNFTTLGAGVLIKKLVNLDVAYSIDNNNSIIGNTLILSVGFNFSRIK